jgi:hypothetical protein
MATSSTRVAGPSSIKTALVFFVVFMVITVNLQDNIVARMGFDVTYLMMTLVAVIFTGMLIYRSSMLIILVLFLSVGANMPEGFMLNFGIDRDYLAWVLVGVVFAPVMGKFFDM